VTRIPPPNVGDIIKIKDEDSLFLIVERRPYEARAHNDSWRDHHTVAIQVKADGNPYQLGPKSRTPHFWTSDDAFRPGHTEFTVVGHAQAVEKVVTYKVIKPTIDREALRTANNL
jgi:hypothetical protein